jgi:TRAP-type uncharacterized transport system substrate-binding protein
MQKTLVILAGTLFFGPLTASAANPPNSPDIVLIDGQPCNRACQSYMAWSRKVTPVPGQPERLSARPATGQVAAGRVTGIREPLAKPRPTRYAEAASGSPQAQIKDSQPASNAADVPAAPSAKTLHALPTAGVATGSGTGTTLQQVTAATAIAERLTTAPTVAIVIARPDIKSVSDLAKKTIALDEKQFAWSGNTRTAIVAAGATGVQLAESQTRAVDRVIGGEVPAAVLALVSRQAAEGFPDVKGFNIFRIPLSSDMPQAETADQRPADAVVSSSHEKTAQELVTAATELAERMTTGTVVSPGAAPPASSNNVDPRIAILLARPDIKSVSDLAHRTIAFDERQSALKSNTRTALTAAGAAGVQLSESQTKAFDRVIGGEVPAGVLTLVSRQAAEGFPDVKGFNIFRIQLPSKEPQAETADQRPADAVASSSHEKTTRELVTAATELAERMTTGMAVSPGAAPPASSNNIDPRIAILIARPDIKSVSDLAHRTIAFDERQSALKSNTRTALVAAGAAGAQLSESQTRALDRVIGGEVPAAVLTLVSRQAAEGFPDVAGFNIFRIPLPSKEPQAEVADQRPADAVVSSSHEKTTQELVAAATTLAERMTTGMAASQGAAPPASSNNVDPRTVVLFARPDIKSVSDLTGKEIAIDDKLPDSSRKIRIAMTAAGATDIRVNERQAKASERVIDGSVPAAVLTLVSREAADAFPDIPGFKIFRIPFTPEKVVDLQPTQAFAAQLDPRATKPAEAKQTTVAVARDGPRANSGDSSGNAARLIARASALLAQGNIIAARDVLGRAAETGSAQASFTLAETYDPLILPKWGVYGTRGDPTKARELYAKAQAGGIEEAKARFEALASSAK